MLICLGSVVMISFTDHVQSLRIPSRFSICHPTPIQMCDECASRGEG